MVISDEKRKVEPGDFAWIAKPWGPKTFKNYPYAKVSGCNRVLDDAATHFNITIWGLARLLGLPWLADVYKWLNGVQRPSQMYMTRLCKLYQLEREGLKLVTVHHIDWDGDGTIHLNRVVNVSGTGGISPKRRSLSPQESKDQELRDKFMAHSPR